VFFWEELLFYVTETHIKLVVLDSVADIISIDIAMYQVPTSPYELCDFLSSND
jgi:hypothetical protein